MADSWPEAKTAVFSAVQAGGAKGVAFADLEAQFPGLALLMLKTALTVLLHTDAVEVAVGAWAIAPGGIGRGVSFRAVPMTG